MEWPCRELFGGGLFVARQRDDPTIDAWPLGPALLHFDFVAGANRRPQDREHRHPDEVRRAGKRRGPLRDERGDGLREDLHRKGQDGDAGGCGDGWFGCVSLSLLGHGPLEGLNRQHQAADPVDSAVQVGRHGGIVNPSLPVFEVKGLIVHTLAGHVGADIGHELTPLILVLGTAHFQRDLIPKGDEVGVAIHEDLTGLRSLSHARPPFEDPDRGHRAAGAAG